jgi:hypothetical protein
MSLLMMRSEATTAAGIALAVGIALALVLDLASPRGTDAKVATTAPSAAAADSLDQRMEAQIAAGAPGVALAMENAASPDSKKGASVAAAHAHAVFELGDAPAALKTVEDAKRLCEVAAGCTPYEKGNLDRLDLVIGAVVAKGVVDPRAEPQKVDEALKGLMPGAGFAH